MLHLQILFLFSWWYIIFSWDDYTLEFNIFEPHEMIKLKHAGRHTILLLYLQENSYVSMANSCKMPVIECEM